MTHSLFSSKTKKANVCFAALLVFISVASFAQISFQKRIDVDKEDHASAIKIYPTDSSKIIAGYSNKGAFLIKTDKLGNPLWSRAYSDTAIKSINDMVITSDGGFALIGDIVSSTFTTTDILVIKVNSTGFVQWKQIWGGTDNETASSIKVTNDGGFIFVGATSSHGSLGIDKLGKKATDVYLIKFTISGSIQWTRTYGNASLNETGNDIIQTNSGGYIIAGENEASEGSTIGFIISTNANGTLTWAKEYGAKGKDGKSLSSSFSSVQQTKDSLYVLAGTIHDKLDKALQIKVDSKGMEIWSKTYSSNYNLDAKKVCLTTDGGYAIGGTVFGHDSLFDLSLIKTDSMGNLKKAVRLGGIHAEKFGSFAYNYELLGYSLVGSTESIQSTSSNKSDIYLITTDSSFSDGCPNEFFLTVTSQTLTSSVWGLSIASGLSVSNLSLQITTNTITVVDGCLYNPITANFSSTNNCANDSVAFINTSNGSLFDWNFGDPASGTNNTSTSFEPTHKYSAIGNYSVTLTVSDLYGTSLNTLTKSITIDNCSKLVWPGDANNDLVTNNYDLLPIGLYYGKTGIARNSISNSWTGFNSNDWGISQANGKDLKFSDCNGDGIINKDDTLAIAINFGLTHYKKEDILKNEATNPVLKLVSTDTSYGLATTIKVELWAGDNSNKVNKFYGLGFDISYNPSRVQAGLTSISLDQSFMGSEILNIAKVDELNGKIYASITRNNHTNANGYGKIATLKFKTNTSITSLTNDLQLAITNYQANDSAGTTINFNVPASVAIDKTVGINTSINTLQEVAVYPNPNSGNFTVTIEYVNSPVSISIIDITGRTLLTQTSEHHKSNFSRNIDLSNYSKGIYFLKVKTKDAIAVRKIVLE